MGESSDASAARQFRMSPGGSIPNCSRSRPELPPSSVTVAMAVTQSQALADVVQPHC